VGVGENAVLCASKEQIGKPENPGREGCTKKCCDDGAPGEGQWVLRKQGLCVAEAALVYVEKGWLRSVEMEGKSHGKQPGSAGRLGVRREALRKGGTERGNGFHER